jgi:MarR family transcriptional regulator, 2-MHQ and catechol-resistance regulon repressor
MDLIPLIRELVRTYQAFESFSAAHIRTMQLTPPQFDVIVTLGNQPPMTCKLLGEKTLITKGTLTGILDRLEQKGLITRLANDEDARSQKIGLTEAGERLFAEVFPSHKVHMQQITSHLNETEILEITASLKKLRASIEPFN